jgi:cold shock CspA family protein
LRLKGKVVKWNSDKAFGFVAPNGGGDNVFIHKTALANRNRTPQLNEVITFTITKDKDGRYCASDATFTGEKLKKKEAKKSVNFQFIYQYYF